MIVSSPMCAHSPTKRFVYGPVLFFIALCVREMGEAPRLSPEGEACVQLLTMLVQWARVAITWAICCFPT
jgi:hypothetical protein